VNQTEIGGREGNGKEEKTRRRMMKTKGKGFKEKINPKRKWLRWV